MQRQFVGGLHTLSHWRYSSTVRFVGGVVLLLLNIQPLSMFVHRRQGYLLHSLYLCHSSSLPGTGTPLRALH